MARKNKLAVVTATCTAALALVLMAGCGGTANEEATETGQPAIEEPQTDKAAETAATEQAQEATALNIKVGDKTLEAVLADTPAAQALAEQLAQGPLTLQLSEYGGFEKVGPLGFELSANDEEITTEPGDILLYQGNQLTIYYDENTWSFTRLAKIEGATTESLLDTLGEGDVEVTLELG
ncbi:MAG: cyclophilin-like fold protein [Coriobacteriales bacterium]